MNNSTAGPFMVVKNQRGAFSIWRSSGGPPPKGWTALPFQGERSDCLDYIAEIWQPEGDRGTTPRSNGPEAIPIVAGSESLTRATCSIPFPRPDPALRLFCFPHAGSGASFYHFLARELHGTPVVAHLIQYPGREMRVKEAPPEAMPIMVATLLAGLEPTLGDGRPFAFFGHSMGALIAYELAHALRTRGLPPPTCLFFSGRQAPHLPAQNLPVDSLSDDAFLEAVGKRYNAIPRQVLEHPEILELILPSLRADFKLMADYVYRSRPPLDVPLVLFNGRDDPWVSDETLESWKIHGMGKFARHFFDGDHFYLPANANLLGEKILAELNP